ncbi:unnamed protein product [Toxocara canis]|uniref:Uncharacterized protein n=1 Tax=Toxocara canis TaxID=6265 RepID=A0A3P7HAB9_TOXCA|nr:unnamed protein product [Toxocara canis]
MMPASFDYLIHRAFFQWGLLAHRFRLALLIAPILLTVFLSAGFIYIKQQTTIDPQYVFSTKSAPWRYERDVLSQHWPLNEQEFWPGKSYDYNGYIDIIAAGKFDRERGRPNMLSATMITMAILILSRLGSLTAREADLTCSVRYIIHNLTISVTHNGKMYEVGYTDLCMSYDWKCYLNDHITMLMPKNKWADFRGKLAELANDIITNEVKVTYPIGWRGTEPIYFGALIGSPHLEGHFDYVRAVRLTYNVREEKVGNVSYLWRKKVATYLADTNNPASGLIEFGMYHNESLPEGLQQVADSLTPKFAVTCTILFAFCGLSCVVLLNHNGFFAPDWVRSKPSIALAGKRFYRKDSLKTLV